MEAIQSKPFGIIANNLENQKDSKPANIAQNISQKNTSKNLLNPAEQHIKEDTNSEKIVKKKEKISVRVNSYLKEKYCTEHQVVGIEIHPEAIRVAEAIETENSWKLQKLISEPALNSFNFESLKKNKQVYTDILKKIFAKNKIQNKNVAVAIPASLAIVKNISLPLMTAENLAKATKIPSFWQNLVQISESLNEYSIFYKITKEIPEKKEMDILFVAVKQSDLNVYKDIISSAGLNLVVVDVGCFPIINLSKLASKSKDSEITEQAYLKIGKDENYLEILEDGKPNIYDIFVPENEKAYLGEYLEHQTFQQRFSSQLKHILNKHEEKFQNKISKIDVISSEATIDKFITELNGKIEEIDFEQTNLFDNLDVDEKLFGKNTENRSAFAITTGLATRKIEIFSDDEKKSVSDSINLLPNAKNIKRDLKVSFYSKVALGIVVAICSIIVASYSVISASKYQANYNEISKFNNLQRVFEEKQKLYNEISGKSGNLNRLVKFSNTIPANQDNILNSFAEISTHIPEGLWLERIEIDETSLVILGRSFEEKNIIGFAKAFEDNEIIENVTIKTMKSLALDNGSLIKEFVMVGKIMNFEKVKLVKSPETQKAIGK